MNVVAKLAKDHEQFRRRLSEGAERIGFADFPQTLDGLIREYKDHEAGQTALFEKVLRAKAGSEDLWPLRGYREIHEGSRTLLGELQRLVPGGDIHSIQRAFTNFRLLALSHFDYEEDWIFPLIEKNGLSKKSLKNIRPDRLEDEARILDVA